MIPVMSNLERAPALTLAGACPSAALRPVREVIAAHEVDLGEGTRVRRLLPKPQRARIGAWCFIDHFGPLDVSGGPGMQVPPHPHIGLQTVTWLLDGEVMHRDSLGNQQLIRPGQLNLMTAGRGIAHAEESPHHHPPMLHGVQLWIALPQSSSSVDPSFEHVPELPVVESAGVRLTVLLGEMLGVRSPAHSHSRLVGVDLELRAPDEPFMLPLHSTFEYGAVTLTGAATVDGVALPPGALLYLGAGREAVGVDAAGAARILLLGGEPTGEPLYMWWNFVAHTAEEIAQASADWAAGRRFGEVPGASAPRVPAPPLLTARLKPRP
jgi:quercetin 2,3-dioxygenase